MLPIIELSVLKSNFPQAWIRSCLSDHSFKVLGVSTKANVASLDDRSKHRL